MPALITHLFNNQNNKVPGMMTGVKKRISRFFLAVMMLLTVAANAQRLQPGFDKAEYEELMKVSARSTVNPKYYDSLPAPEHFKMIYQSKVIGLDNSWDLWKNEQNVAAISIRGTTSNGTSWLANFYAGMVSAKGTLQVTKDYRFTYQLAENPKAFVHAGWLLSLAFLGRDMLPKIDSMYKTGTRDMLIMGHSQGGAIAFLLTAYLYNLQKSGQLPADIRFKTYCSAGPKPGNLYFAYEYEALTQNGWAYNVVNSADWVPETPISIQTLNDFNTTNPFKGARAMMKKQGFLKGLVLTHMYNRMDRITKRAVRRYCRNLGKRVGNMLEKSKPGFEAAKYTESLDYVRTGNTIVLLADEAYYRLYPDSDTNVFVHHFHEPYLYLLHQLK